MQEPSSQQIWDRVASGDSLEGLFIGLLLGGEAAAVHPIVDVGVDPLIHSVDVLPQMLWVDVHLRVLGVLVHCIVEHAHDVGALVVHNALRLLIPEHRHCELACRKAHHQAGATKPKCTVLSVLSMCRRYPKAETIKAVHSCFQHGVGRGEQRDHKLPGAMPHRA